MKRKLILVTIMSVMVLLMGTFVACGDDGKLDITIGYPSSWPDNDYTANIPAPDYGEIAYSEDYNDGNVYVLNYNDYTYVEGNAYLEKLKAAGFEVEKDNSDESYYSYGFKVRDGRSLNISYPTAENGARKLRITISR